MRKAIECFIRYHQNQYTWIEIRDLFRLTTDELDAIRYSLKTVEEQPNDKLIFKYPKEHVIKFLSFPAKALLLYMITQGESVFKLTKNDYNKHRMSAPTFFKAKNELLRYGVIVQIKRSVYQIDRRYY